MTKDAIVTTIRMEREIWLKLRRLQEDGKIKSIHQAFIDAIKTFIKEIK